MHNKTMRIRVIKTYRLLLMLYFVVLLICSGTTFVIPICISDYINDCVSSKNIINHGLVLLITIASFELLFKSLKNEMNIRLSNKMAFDLEHEILTHIMNSDYQEIFKYDNAYLAQRLNNDTVIVGDFVCEKMPYFIMNIITIIAIYAYIFWLNFWIGMVFVLFILVYVGLYMIMKRGLSNRAKKMFEAQASFFSMLSNQFNSILMIKTHALYKEKRNEFQDNVKQFYEKSLLFLRLEFTIKNLSEYAGRVLMMVVVYMLGYKVVDGQLAIGLMTGLILYIEVLISKMGEVVLFGDSFQKYLVACDRITELESLELEQNGIMECTAIKKIELSNLSCRLGETVLHYPNIILEKNKVYVLKGKNGAGKSTLVNMLLGIINPYQGDVLYDGISIRNIEKNSLRRNLIAVKNQSPYIVDGTLGKNITYGIENESQMDNAFFNKLLSFSSDRGGLETEICAQNTNLSGGEQQRVAICRTMYKDAAFIILDEPTNALDENSKMELVSFIKTLQNKIVLIISHDKVFEQIADEIIYV